MCAKAIVDARINHLYFGASEPKTGAIESIDQFFRKITSIIELILAEGI